MGIPTGDFVQNALFSDFNGAFGASAAANTVVESAEVDLPADGSGTRDGVLFVANPSLTTDLICRVYIKRTMNAAAVWCLLTTFNVPKSPDATNPIGAQISGVAIPLTGVFVGEKIELVWQNTSTGDVGGIDVRAHC